MHYDTWVCDCGCGYNISNVSGGAMPNPYSKVNGKHAEQKLTAVSESVKKYLEAHPEAANNNTYTPKFSDSSKYAFPPIEPLTSGSITGELTALSLNDMMKMMDQVEKSIAKPNYNLIYSLEAVFKEMSQKAHEFSQMLLEGEALNATFSIHGEGKFQVTVQKVDSKW